MPSCCEWTQGTRDINQIYELPSSPRMPSEYARARQVAEVVARGACRRKVLQMLKMVDQYGS